MKRLRSIASGGLNYANVMSTIAVFLALAGGGFAIASSSSTKVIKKVVRNLAPTLSVRHAGSADTATSANQATNANHATSANQAANADALDGFDSSGFGAGMMTGHVNGLTTVTNTNDSAAVSGISSAVFSDTPIAMWTPNVSILASDLSVRLSAAPGGGSQRTFYIYASPGGGPTAVSCPISGAALTCNSGGATAVIPPNALIELREDTNSVAPAPADAFFGWRARPAP